MEVMMLTFIATFIGTFFFTSFTILPFGRGTSG